MDKTAIKNFAIEARKILMKSAISEAGFYGITKDECKSPVQKGKDFEVYETLAGTENRIYGDDIKRRANLVKAIKEQGFDQVIEETAYTWFNRIIAIRFMEVNNYLPTRVRVLSSETGSGTPDIITQADTVDLNLTAEELDRIQSAKRENKYDEAFRLLFVKQCNELNAILPGLFEKTDDYMELLLKITYTSDGVVRMLVDTIPEDNFNVETEGQVEIIGWMYQYYNTELKDDTFAKLKKNVKITKERIPAATQLFTPDWIVRYMVENSLGRVWIEHLRAVDPSTDEKAKAEEFGWKYYLPEAEQEDDVAAQLVEIRQSYKNLTPQDITCIDPCMGSGHILVYMFDVLMDIYRSEGFSEREAVFDILEKNIRGLDIDRRAYQLSYFALMMKSRSYNRIFFRGREDAEGKRTQAVPQIYAIEGSNNINRIHLNYLGAGLSEFEKNTAKVEINELLEELADARDYGSILHIKAHDWQLIKKFAESCETFGQMSIETVGIEKTQLELQSLIKIASLLAAKYLVTITNPPYMNSSGMNAKLSNFIKTNYPDSKSDISFCFMEKCKEFTTEYGKFALINIPVWMTLSSCEKLRLKTVDDCTLFSLLNFGRGIFGSDFGSCAFVLQNGKIQEFKSRLFKLFEKQGSVEKIEIKENNFDERKGERIFKLEDFLSMPGHIISCSITRDGYNHFINDENIGKYGTARQGLITGKNDLFLRMWYEVETSKMCTSCKDSKDTNSEIIKWYPYDKGGEYKKWYGNNWYVVNWQYEGKEIRSFVNDKGKLKSRPQNIDFYFKPGLTWTALTAGKFSMRYSSEGNVFDAMGPKLFSYSEEDEKYILGLLNSCVGNMFLEVLCPNFKFDQKPIENIPIIFSNKEEITSLVQECINITKSDYDAYELSYNYRRDPLIPEMLGQNVFIQDMYRKWNEKHAQWKKKLLECEEEINRHFITIYKLEDELSPFVDEDDVTLTEVSEQEAVKNLLSYAIGCIMGRYSLDADGVVYAGGEWNESLYVSFNPDSDGVLPLNEEQYFEDDIIGILCNWLTIVYGGEVLEQNLHYIAEQLGSKGNNDKDVIRNYFLTDFFDDHCNLFSISGSGKRPIYWMFNSGSENGFKCLVYMHRYHKDLVGIIRSEYLIKTQSAIENALCNAEDMIAGALVASDKAMATKKRNHYIKQLNEIKNYYPALSHIALQRIEIDFDDGVKENYSKFQGIEISNEGEKKRKVDLLAKI